MNGKPTPSSPELRLVLSESFRSVRRRDPETLRARLSDTVTRLAFAGLYQVNHAVELRLDPSWHESALLADGWSDQAARRRRVALIAPLLARGERLPIGQLGGVVIEVFLVADPVSRLVIAHSGLDPYLVVWSNAL
jgi:hypothetical protein